MSKKKVRKTKKIRKTNIKESKKNKVRGEAGMMSCCNDSGGNRPYKKEHKTRRIKESDKKKSEKRNDRTRRRTLEDHRIVESAVDKNWQQLTEKRDTYHESLRKNRPDKPPSKKKSWFLDW